MIAMCVHTHTHTPPYLHVLQVLYALNHVLLLSGALCCTLSQSSSSGCWTLVVFVITVWRTQLGVTIVTFIFTLL